MPAVITNISPIEPGGESLVSAKRANELIDAINAIRNLQAPAAGNIVTASATRSQVFLDFSKLEQRLQALEASSGGNISGNNVSGQLPFGVSDTSPNATYPTVNVRYASVGGIIPAGIAANIALTAPTSNTEIYLNITINNNAVVTAASINTGATPSPNTSTKAYARIANVQVAGSLVTAISQDLLFSQSFVACNRNTADPVTTPGTYFLQVS